MAYERSLLSKFKRMMRTLRSRIGSILFPKWLKRITAAIKKGVRNAEVRVAKSGRKIAKSQVAQSAKSLSVGLKKVESKVTESTRRASEGVAKSKVGKTAKRVTAYVNRVKTIVIAIASAFQKSFISASQLLVPKPIRRWFSAIFGGIWKTLSVCGGFVVKWLKTRQYRQLIGAIPAIVLAFPLAFFLVRIPFYAKNEKAEYYRKAASKAAEDKDFAVANLCYRKLQQLGGLNEFTEFQNAFYTYEQGEEAQAVEMMRKLAPSDEPGFGAAHVWLAQWLLSGKSELASDTANNLAQKHLQFALERNPENPTARAIRAKAFKQVGELDRAVSELEEVVRQLPSQGLSLAELYRQQGRYAESKATLQRIASYFEARNPEADSVSASDYQVWARTVELLGDREKAEQLYNEGVAKFSDNKYLKERAVNHFLAMSELASGPSDDSSKIQIEYIVRAVNIEPNNSSLLTRLVDLSVEPGSVGTYAMAAVKNILDSESPPSMLWSIFGTALASGGKLEESMEYLSRGIAENPDDALSLNNAAWVRLQLNYDLDGTYELVNRALQIEPKNPIFRETRGQVHLRQKKWEKAIEDFEFAINGFGQPNPTTHHAIAFAYEQLHQFELAELHRQMAQRLQGS